MLFLAISTLLLLVLAVGLALLLLALGLPEKQYRLRLQQSLTLGLPLIILLASWFMTRCIEGRPLGSVGLKFHPSWLRELLKGIMIWVLISSAFSLVAYMLGWTQVSSRSITVAEIPIFLLSIALILALVVFEELLFRGYLLQTLIEGIGLKPAVILIPLLFALAHIPTHDFLAVFGTWLFGIVLTLFYIKMKSLWMPIGIHFANNGLLLIYGVGTEFLSEMGIEFKGFFRVKATGPTLWVGDPSGTTGSLLGLMAILVLMLTLFWKGFKAHPEMEALWQQYVHPAQPWARLREWWRWPRRQEADGGD